MQRIPMPQPPTDERQMLTSLTFFLTGAERAKVVRVLRGMRERDRTGALLRLIDTRPNARRDRS